MTEKLLDNKDFYYSDYKISNTTNLFIDVLEKYNDIQKQYLMRLRDVLTITNIPYMKYVIISGLKTLTHIFRILLFTTKNTELTYEYSNKALYYFIEFISQIGNENNSYLNLTPKDAGLFVYKKTIFNIVNEYIKIENKNETQQYKELLHFITETSNLRIIKSISSENFKSLCDMDSLLEKMENYNKIMKKMIENSSNTEALDPQTPSRKRNPFSINIMKRKLQCIIDVENIIYSDENGFEILEQIIKKLDKKYSEREIKIIKDTILNKNTK